MLGIIGSGSWATALAKILTDGNQHINWWVRNAETRDYIQNRRHNPHYLSSVYFDTSLLSLENDLSKVIADSDIIIIAVPSVVPAACSHIAILRLAMAKSRHRAFTACAAKPRTDGRVLIQGEDLDAAHVRVLAILMVFLNMHLHDPTA